MDVVEGEEPSGSGGVGVGGRDAEHTLDGCDGLGAEVDALALSSDGLVVGVGGEDRVEGCNLDVGGVCVVGKCSDCQGECVGREGDSLVGSAQAGFALEVVDVDGVAERSRRDRRGDLVVGAEEELSASTDLFFPPIIGNI